MDDFDLKVELMEKCLRANGKHEMKFEREDKHIKFFKCKHCPFTSNESKV